jgi:site-specific recombinase XerD
MSSPLRQTSPDALANTNSKTINNIDATSPLHRVTTDGPVSNVGTRELDSFLKRNHIALEAFTPKDYLAFREAVPKRKGRSIHQSARILNQARERLRTLVDDGTLDRERFLLLLSPAGASAPEEIRRSRAFNHLTQTSSRTYRRGAHQLLLHLETLGKRLSDVTPEDWLAFKVKLRDAVRAGDVSRSLARMRLAGARILINEGIQTGTVAPHVFQGEKAPEPAWPPAFSVWKAHIDRWCGSSGLAANTVLRYKRDVREFMNWLAGEGISDMGDVTRELVTSYQLHLQQVQTKKGRPLATATQIGALAAIRSYFAYLFGAGVLLTDPTTHIVYPRAPRTLPRVVGVDVMKRIFRALPNTLLGKRDRTMLELLYGTGIRAGELMRLKLEDVDLESSTLSIRLGKGRKDRVVPLGSRAKDALTTYLHEVRPKLLAQQTDVVFLGRHGTELSIRGMRHRLAELGVRTRVRLHPHLLRHTCATHLLKGRADIRHIQRLLGHESLATTERYTRVEVSDLRAVIRRCHPREKNRA